MRKFLEIHFFSMYNFILKHFLKLPARELLIKKLPYITCNGKTENCNVNIIEYYSKTKTDKNDKKS